MKYTQSETPVVNIPATAIDRLQAEVRLLRDRIAHLDAHGDGSGYEKRLQSAYISLLQDRLAEMAVRHTPSPIVE